MDLYRKAISDFIRASETILSPAILGESVTEEERKVIEFYVEALSQHCRSLESKSQEKP